MERSSARTLALLEMKYEIHGAWRKGYAFDLHTIASAYLGPDEFGHDRFANTRSEMGEFIYRLKYRSDLTTIPKIVGLLAGIKGIEKFDVIVPVPSSNTSRAFQPVDEIAKALGESRGVPVLAGFLQKTAKEQLKNVTNQEERQRLLERAIRVAGTEDISQKTVLLVDDLYRSGSTLNACCSVLIREAEAASVCVLAMTKTRSNR